MQVGAVKDGIVQVRIGGSYHSPTRGYRKIAGLSTLHLRLDPPRNGQRGAINWASDYELGAVAQLAERSAGSRKVGGSNPPSSTQASPETIGAHVFRNHFGWYAQRAAGGETFNITRRGKPFVTLSPPLGQLTAAEAAGS